MVTCMDGHMYGWSHIWMVTCMDGHMLGCSHVWMVTCMNGHMYGWSHVWMVTGMNGHMYGQSHAWMVTCMDGQMHGWSYVWTVTCMDVCSGSVVVTAYDFESGCPGLNPEWETIYYKASIAAQGLPELSSLRDSTMGTRAAEHKGCNWGMQVD